MERKVKLGIFGGWRGDNFINIIKACGAEIVAVCEKKNGAEEKIHEKHPEIKVFKRFDDFIKEDMDAVILANYFHKHTEYAIKAMEAGKGVLSETMPSVTMAESVKLCRAVERTGMFYTMIENFPYFKGNFELKRLCEGGTLGKFIYGEGEYFHPNSRTQINHLSPGIYHWRNWIPATYYISHSLAPILYITGEHPKRVTAMAAFDKDTASGTAKRNADALAMMLIQTKTDAMIRVCGCAGLPPHGDWYRISGCKGGAELVRGTKDKVRLCYFEDNRPDENTPYEQVYETKWPDYADIAEKCGHDGGDFWAIHFAIECIKEGKKPFFDVYRATEMSSVAILAWRSVLNGNIGYDIPDFRLEEDRIKYENDDLSPFPNKEGIADIPCCSHQDYEPSDEDIRIASTVDWPIYDTLLNDPKDVE